MINFVLQIQENKTLRRIYRIVSSMIQLIPYYIMEEFYTYQKKLNVPIILSGQRALIAKRFLINLGISATEIMIENKSRDTFENAKFTRDICIRSDYKKPILITSAYHLKRSILSFEKVGLEVIPFPASFKSWKDKQYGWTAYLPGNFAKASIALKEYAGLIFYRFAY